MSLSKGADLILAERERQISEEATIKLMIHFTTMKNLYGQQ
jgi:hypothetical protein